MPLSAAASARAVEGPEAPLLPEGEGDLADPVLLDGVDRGEAGGQGVTEDGELGRMVRGQEREAAHRP